MNHNIVDLNIKLSPNDVDKVKQLLSQLNIEQTSVNILNNLDEQEFDLLSDDDTTLRPDMNLSYQDNFHVSESGLGDIDLISNESDDQPMTTDVNTNIIGNVTDHLSPIDPNNNIQSNQFMSHIYNEIFSIHPHVNFQQTTQIPFINDEFYKPPVAANPSNKIILNVGGKKFNIKKNWLDYLNINIAELHKISDDKSIFFLDRDPFYFSKIIDIVKASGHDTSKIIENIDEYSEQLINELCVYALIDEKYRPTPKLKLKRTVGFVNENTKNNIIKLVVTNQTFETFLSTLSKSGNMMEIIHQNAPNKYILQDVDPKVFRHILNLLRFGYLCIYSNSVMQLLQDFGIEYDLIQNKKIDQPIVPYHLSHGTEAFEHHISSLQQYVSQNSYYQKFSHMMHLENYNIITTNSKLAFGTNIIFNLTNSHQSLYETISELYVSIDIPILNPIESIEYVDMIEYHLIDSASIYYSETNMGCDSIGTITSDYLYLYPIIYTHNNDYHQVAGMSSNKLKVLYNNTLIDIHRITLPLFSFKMNPLPIKRMIDNAITAQLVIKMASLQKILKTPSNIPLLNITLTANYINKVFPINNHPSPYIFNRLHPLVCPVPISDNQIYDELTIPLTNMGLIKDFFFVIISKDNHIAGTIDRFCDNLIEIEINCDNTCLCKLDSTMLNYYIPLKNLSHKLPIGVYYYSFSLEPMKNIFLGGCVGQSCELRFRVKKLSDVIRLYVHEYFSVML